MTSDSTSWDTADGIVAGVAEQADDDVFAVNPPMPVFRAIAASDHDVNFRVVLAEDDAKTIFSDFITASHAAEKVRDDQLEVRTHQNEAFSPTVATEGFVASVAYTGSSVVGIGTESSKASTVFNANSEAFDAADEFSFRTPPRDTVLETLNDDVSEEIRADFEHVLGEVDTLAGDRPGLDEVEALLLLGAKHENLLYDLSKWGEDISLASKATFSRAKSRLEERDLIQTVKVPIEVGRPRLRLLLPDDLNGKETTELIEAAAGRFE